ncbi:MAG TPA: glutamate--cysteine ligase [Steroidobacteraceae bacterium]|nr:glutamate--cysteine ligase [Steroidobacteraceae bacterium]
MNRGIDQVFERRLAGLINSRERGVMSGGRKGVEKESLRVTPEGRLAQTTHPEALGSTLTNEFITTDYSEALIELVTPTFTESWELLQFLCDLHQFVYRHLGDELLWATSMPSNISGDAEIPIARYGRSNIGRMKEVYRTGLGHRYGRMMQAISGVHFNYSFPDHFWTVLAAILETGDDQAFRSDRYFALLRNYRRYGWLVLYLFGNSPCASDSFISNLHREHTLRHFTRDTWYEPYATSLRMSDLGYRNKSQAHVSISVNSIDEYIRDLSRLIAVPSAEYQRIGVKVDGEYKQLNANVLQIENEYYSFIRPKRVGRSGERPTQALKRGGVEYVEVRALDVSAFDPVGVNQNKLRFLEAFLALCVLKDSPPIEAAEEEVLDNNHIVVAHRGREPGLMLNRNGRAAAMHHWALELLDSMQGICEMLDQNSRQKPYAAALEIQRAKVLNVALTPSARTITELNATGQSFAEFALDMSVSHKAYFLDLYPPNERRLEEFRVEAEESLRRREAIEAADKTGFEEFLAQYFAT